MPDQLTLEQLEQQVAQLSPHEQLRLAAHICERVSAAEQSLSASVNAEAIQQRGREVAELLALCDAAADMWDGDFDATEEIREMRQERDDQLWLNRS